MKITSLQFKIAFSLTTVLFTSVATFAAPFGAASATQQFVPGEVLVKFKPAVSAQTKSIAVSAVGGSISAKLNNDLLHVKLVAGQSVESTVATYTSDPNVEYAQPNYIYHIAQAPNDTDYGQQWAFGNTGQTIGTPSYATNNPGSAGKDMNMQLAWDQITDCSSVVVAVVDSGVNYNHQDLLTNMWNGGTTYPNHGYNFTSEGLANNPMDLNGHGTHVAGIIGAVGNNAMGTTGVCWKASIMAVRVMDTLGTGTTATISQGINFASAHGAKVINISIGGIPTYDSVLSAAITAAQTADAVVVAAAGNEAVDNDLAGKATYPCNFTQANLICVAALDQNDALANFSNWGSTSVDVGAPGTNVLSTWAGTSASASDTMDGLTFSWFVNGAGGFTLGQTTPNTFPYNAGTYNSLNFPGVATWPTGTAPANKDARIWTVLNLSSFDAVTLDVFGAAHVVSDGGVGGAAMAYSASGADPFAGTPTYFSGTSLAATETTPATVPMFSAMPTVSLFGCNKSATCSVGFQLKTGATATNLGMSVVGFTINALTLNNTTYKLENGTSMATPAVAGLATMLRAYNPQYTANDVVSSIKNSGRAIAGLVGKTTTGRAVDAMKSLAHINTPAGLAATVQ